MHWSVVHGTLGSAAAAFVVHSLLSLPPPPTTQPAPPPQPAQPAQPPPAEPTPAIDATRNERARHALRCAPCAARLTEAGADAADRVDELERCALETCGPLGQRARAAGDESAAAREAMYAEAQRLLVRDGRAAEACARAKDVVELARSDDGDRGFAQRAELLQHLACRVAATGATIVPVDDDDDGATERAPWRGRGRMSERQAVTHFEDAVDALRQRNNKKGCRLLAEIAEHARAASRWREKAENLFARRCED